MPDTVIINKFKCQVYECPTSSHDFVNSNGYLLCERRSLFESYAVDKKQKIEVMGEELFAENSQAHIFGFSSFNKTSDKLLKPSISLHDLGLHQKDFCLFEEKRKCETEDDSFLISSLATLDSIFYVIGLLAILGNLYVIYSKSKSLVKTKDDKERTIFNVLSLNLALADFVMGVAVIMFALEITYHSHILNHHSSELQFCNAIGILTFISNQVSISMLVIISALRLHGVTHPYRRAHLGTTISVVVAIWCVWTVVACFPVLYQSSALFAGGVRRIEDISADISFESFINFTEELLAKNPNITESFQAIFNSIQNDKSPENLAKALENLSLIKEDEWDFIGFYNQDPFVCIASPLAEFNKNSEVLTIIILVIDLLSFSFVTGAYITIIKRVVAGKSAKRKLKESFRRLHHSHSKRKSMHLVSRRKIENKKMLRTVMIIVATDIFVYIPIFIISIFHHWLVESGPDGYSKRCHSTLYSWLTLYILFTIPLNSLINPYVYSMQIWIALCKKAKTSGSKFSSNLGHVSVRSIIVHKR